VSERHSRDGGGTAGGSAAPPSPSEVHEGSTLVRAGLLLKRRAWLFSLTWAGLSLAGGAAAFLLPPLYRPEALLEIRPERPLVAPEASEASHAATLQLWENYFRTQESILRSRGFLETVLAALPPETARVYREAPDGPDLLASRVEVETIPSTFLIRVGVLDGDPVRATEVVNALASLYLEETNRRLREVKAGAVEALARDTLPAIRRRVDEADRNLRAFQSKSGFADFEEQYASLLEARRKVAARLSEVRLRRVALRSERDALAQVPADDPAALFAPALQRLKTFDSLLSRRASLEAEIAREAPALKEKHPRRVALAEQLRGAEEKLRQAVRAAFHALDRELAAAEREAGALQAEQERIERDMSDARARLTQYRKLEGELAAARDLHASYVKRLGESQATSGAGLASVRVLELARVPSEPHRKSRVFLTLGIVLGLLFGGAAVALAEHVDDRLRSPREAEVFLGLDVLGVIPRRGPEATPGRPLLLEDDPVSLDLEAFRALRSEVAARMDPGARTLAVLGPRGGEGTSTAAIHLARVLALEGRRVLLLDAGLRRPALKAFLADERGPGLEELLREDLPFDRAVQATRLAGVDVLGAERELEGPAEEVTSTRFRAVLARARGAYDAVILDAGPVNVFTEPAIVARQADATLLVVREGETRRGEARAAARRLGRLGARLLGTVVNASRSARTGASPPPVPPNVPLEDDLVAWV
jgi:capsular exopolysaccharide synthesis family protein